MGCGMFLPNMRMLLAVDLINPWVLQNCVLSFNALLSIRLLASFDLVSETIAVSKILSDWLNSICSTDKVTEKKTCSPNNVRSASTPRARSALLNRASLVF